MHKAVLKDSSTSFGVYGFDDITEQPLQLYIHLQLSYELFRVHSEEEILCQSRSKFVQFAENSSLLRLLRQLLTQLNYIAPFHNKFCEPHWLQFHSGWPEIQVCYCGLLNMLFRTYHCYTNLAVHILPPSCLESEALPAQSRKYGSYFRDEKKVH